MVGMVPPALSMKFPFLLVLALAAAPLASAGSKLGFNRDVRPILAEKCFACHGFDKKGRKGNLRLDTREGALASQDGVSAIVPGKPELSELVARVLSADPEEVMPPPKSGKQLSSEEKELLRQWIAEGAAYEKHWSLEPPVAVEPPRPPGATHPIDQFIQARLGEDGLAPAPHELVVVGGR